jgi:hypothetical protein
VPRAASAVSVAGLLGKQLQTRCICEHPPATGAHRRTRSRSRSASAAAVGRLAQQAPLLMLSGAAAGAAPPSPALPADGWAAIRLAALRSTLSASVLPGRPLRRYPHHRWPSGCRSAAPHHASAPSGDLPVGKRAGPPARCAPALHAGLLTPAWP